jgi:hypothetical protein
VSALDDAARIPADYRHVAKLALPGPELSVEGTLLKWYEVAPAGAAVPDRIRGLARGALEGASAAWELELASDIGFVILHRCGQDFYFLLICTWRNQNELWETVWAKDGDADPAFRPWPTPRTHRPTYCVWELGVVCHESRAWSRYLRSERDAAALRAYLEDGFDGTV